MIYTNPCYLIRLVLITLPFCEAFITLFRFPPTESTEYVKNNINKCLRPNYIQYMCILNDKDASNGEDDDEYYDNDNMILSNDDEIEFVTELQSDDGDRNIGLPITSTRDTIELIIKEVIISNKVNLSLYTIKNNSSL